MRFEITASARSDYARLTTEERGLFSQGVAVFNVAADRFAATGDPSAWPRQLRVKSVRHAPGILEMTWSFSGPDGRATWEWATVTDEDGTGHSAVRWRRIGSHAIFSDP